MIPAQRSGATPARLRLLGTWSTKLSINDNAVGIAAVGDASEMRVRKVVRESKVRAELFLTGLALGTGAVGVDHAADTPPGRRA